MRNEDQDCGLAATPRGAATCRLYPSTSRTFCAHVRGLQERSGPETLAV